MSQPVTLRKCAAVSTALAVLLAVIVLGTPAAFAQDDYALDPLPSAEVGGEADPREAALGVLEQVQFALTEAVTSGDSLSAAQTVQVVLNLLEGSQGPHFVPVEGAEGELLGAIPHLESVAGITAEELAEVDLEALIEEGAELPEVLALAHLLLARDTLVEGGADPASLEVAAAHVDQAAALLRGESAWVE